MYLQGLHSKQQDFQLIGLSPLSFLFRDFVQIGGLLGQGDFDLGLAIKYLQIKRDTQVIFTKTQTDETHNGVI